MSLVLAEHFYSIKLFFKYQICLAIKKELDINPSSFSLHTIFSYCMSQNGRSSSISAGAAAGAD